MSPFFALGDVISLSLALLAMRGLLRDLLHFLFGSASKNASAGTRAQEATVKAAEGTARTYNVMRNQEDERDLFVMPYLQQRTDGPIFV